jgi:hypothetical protein
MSVRSRLLLLGLVAALALLSAPSAFAGFVGQVRSTHPDAINDTSRNWTYRGDVVRVSFRNTNVAARGKRQRFRVCFTRGSTLSCQNRYLFGLRTDAWFLRIGADVSSSMRYVLFTWSVGGRRVAQARIWVYE